MSDIRTLKQAPLIHVVAQLNFSALPQLEQAEIQALHREFAAIGFPEMVEAYFNEVQLSFSVNLEDSPQRVSHKNQRFVFKAEGDRSLVEFRKGQLILKTTDYPGHDQFLPQWFEIIKICGRVLPNFNKALLQDMTLRYVDLIVPKEHECLADLVKDDLLPPALAILGGEPLFGSSAKVIRTGSNSQLRIGFAQIPSKEGRLTKVLPDDLAEHDPRCGLSIKGLSHWETLQAPSYGLLDAEHKYIASHKPALGKVNIEEECQLLYQAISSVFWDLITEKAKSSWS